MTARRRRVRHPQPRRPASGGTLRDGFEPVTERVLSALPNLKIISKYGNGCESFDFAAMKRHNIRFGYTWGVNKLAVAELALGFMLMGLRWVAPLNVAMREGRALRVRQSIA